MKRSTVTSGKSALRAGWYIVALALVVCEKAIPAIAASPALVAVYRASTGQWFILDPAQGTREITWGCAGCGTHFPLPGDYNGDGVDDIAIFATASAVADPFIPNTSLIPQGSGYEPLRCEPSCIPISHDFDGDGKAEVAIFDLVTAHWTIRSTSLNGGTGDELRFPFGCILCGDVPVAGRFTALDPATPPLFSRFSLPTQGFLPGQGSSPSGITAGPDGNLWFTESGVDRIGRITPAGVITEFALPTTGSGASGIAAGPDGNLWFTESTGNRIGRITPAGVITEFALPTAGSGPSGITAGADGNLWFTETAADRIGRITPAGVITEFALPTAGSGPTGIVNGPDGNIWFTEINGDRIGRITLGGLVTEFDLPTPGSAPSGITAGIDGNLWFAESGSSRLGRVTPTGEILEYPLSVSPSVGLSAVTIGPDGGLWVKGFYRLFLIYFDIIWRVNASGQVLEQFRPGHSTPVGVETGAITAGPDGRLWFAQPHLDRVGRLGVTVPYTGVAVYRQTTGQWFILEPTGETRTVAWGCPSCGDVPVVSDFDGDGLDDIAVFRRPTAEWFILRSTDDQPERIVWGCTVCGDIPVPRDYDGDGIDDVAVFRPVTGEWFILRSSDNQPNRIVWGCQACGDVPVPARY